MTRRELILASTADAVADLLFYDRKNDEELPPDSVNDAIDAGEISADEIAQAFRDELNARLADR